jgi:hypothetical protein
MQRRAPAVAVLLEARVKGGHVITRVRDRVDDEQTADFGYTLSVALLAVIELDVGRMPHTSSK